MDEVLLDYETRLWSNGYQNKAVPRPLDQQGENDSNEDDDVGDDQRFIRVANGNTYEKIMLAVLGLPPSLNVLLVWQHIPPVIKFIM